MKVKQVQLQRIRNLIITKKSYAMLDINLNDIRYVIGDKHAP